MRLREPAPYAAMIVGLALALNAIACGPGVRQKALTTSLTAVNAARDGFTAWDGDHQLTLVEHANTMAEGQTKLDSYRTKREPILHGFAVAYELIATAALDIDSDTKYMKALESVKHLYDALKALKESIHP